MEFGFKFSSSLSLHKSDKRLNELNEWLLAFMARLGAWCRGFGLSGWEQATGWRRWRASAEMSRQAGQEGAQFRAELLFESLFVSGED